MNTLNDNNTSPPEGRKIGFLREPEPSAASGVPVTGVPVTGVPVTGG